MDEITSQKYHLTQVAKKVKRHVESRLVGAETGGIHVLVQERVWKPPEDCTRGVGSYFEVGDMVNR